MKQNMKNNHSGFLFVLFLSVLTINFASAYNSESCNLDVSLVNQDPYPAIPGDYVELVFQLSGVDNSNCNGAIFEVVPNYPLSLDDNESALYKIDGSTWTSSHKTEWMIPYKLRVDKDALDGDVEIEVHYAPGSFDPDYYLNEKFTVSIQDSRTTFDAVIQEATSSDVSIAIANIGKYTANSVVVRIPEQDSFSVSGTDGQMVGNLESGDYTIVGFSVSEKTQQTQSNFNKDKTNIQNKSNNLKFDIYYTDNIGERRIVSMELQLNTGNISSSIPSANFGMQRKTSSSIFTKWYLWVLLVVIVSLFFIYKKYPSETKEIISKLKIWTKKENKKLSNEIPDWVKNTRDKEKKK